MKFDTSIEYEANKARTNLEYLISKQKVIDQTAVRAKRSIDQNSYLHVAITLYAIYVGSTLSEAKTDLKRGCHFMQYEKNGKKYLKETSKMDSKELADFIDWIRNYSAVRGYYIATSKEYLLNKYAIDKEIDQNKHYL